MRHWHQGGPGKGAICLVLILALRAGGQTTNLYENNFEAAEIGKAPAEFLVLDGGFVVKEEKGNKFLELPGAPLDSFAVQFGPAEAENIAVSARIKGSAKGRRYPTFGIGLNGAAGYRLQVSPGKKELEIYKDQEAKASARYQWSSGKWTRLRLQVRKTGEADWKIEGKAWDEGNPEPEHSMLSVEAKEAPATGKASLFGSPFAGTPIQFDDVVVSRVNK